MHELALRVPAFASEDVLDRLLPLAPYGIHEVVAGDQVELRVRGPQDELPSAAAVAASAGSWPHELSEREVPDDWDARRRLDYEPRVVAGRLIVRPPWAPPAPPGVLDVVLEERDAFGGGGHPTTWACLEALFELEPSGSLADLGCGSGVLAIAAAQLGFDPLVAVDREASALEVTRVNAEVTEVSVEARQLDLMADRPPPARTVVANVPPEVHSAIAGRISTETDIVLASGLLATAADHVADLYTAAGFSEHSRSELGGWAVLILRRD